MAVALTTPKAPNGAFRSRTSWEQAKVDRYRARQAQVDAQRQAEAAALLRNRNAARVALVAAASHSRSA